MKITNAARMASVFAMSLAMASCTASGPVTETATEVTVGPATYKHTAKRDSTDRVFVVESNDPICVELVFRGSNGEELGKFNGPIPMNGQIPAGAVSYHGMRIDCKEDVHPGGHMFDPLAQGSQQQSPPHQLKGRENWLAFGGMLEPSIAGDNVTYAFGIDTYNHQGAMNRRDQVLAAGIGADVGPGVTVYHYSESNTEFGMFGTPVGVRTRHALLSDDFTTCTLFVNNVQQADMNNLGEMLHYAAGNGWNVLETFVPVSALETGLTFENKAELFWTTQETTGAHSVIQSVIAD